MVMIDLGALGEALTHAEAERVMVEYHSSQFSYLTVMALRAAADGDLTLVNAFDTVLCAQIQGSLEGYLGGLAQVVGWASTKTTIENIGNEVSAIAGTLRMGSGLVGELHDIIVHNKTYPKDSPEYVPMMLWADGIRDDDEDKSLPPLRDHMPKLGRLLEALRQAAESGESEQETADALG